MEELIAELRRQGLLGPEESPEPATLIKLLPALVPDPATARVLETVAETAPKPLAKEARRVLHLWRSRGLAVPQASPGQAWALKAESRPLGAMASQIDRRGDRFLFYAYRRPSSPYVILLAIGGDRGGLVMTEVYEPPNKREYQALKERIREMEGLTFIPVDPDYCRAWLHHYYRINRQQGRPVPRDFELYRASLGPELPLPECPVYHHLSPQDLEAERPILLAGSDELLTEKEMSSWVLEGPEVEGAKKKIGQQQSSPLVISPVTAREIAERIKQELVEQYFHPEFRPVFSRRLEEMAYLFWKTGRPLQARRALALARALNEGANPAFIPFFRLLAERALAPQGAAPTGEVRLGSSRLYLPGWSRPAQK
ncbi:MAG: hypothetical protein ACPLPT_00100 [Moorellales bacterium]